MARRQAFLHRGVLVLVDELIAHGRVALTAGFRRSRGKPWRRFRLVLLRVHTNGVLLARRVLFTFERIGPDETITRVEGFARPTNTLTHLRERERKHTSACVGQNERSSGTYFAARRDRVRVIGQT